jgi:small subunit ribosomal protein S20
MRAPEPPSEKTLANHKSALKRIRQSAKRQKHNQHIRSGMRTEIKRFREAIEAGDSGAASERFAAAERAIRRASSKGLIPRQRADRSVGRLAKTLNALGG